METKKENFPQGKTLVLQKLEAVIIRPGDDGVITISVGGSLEQLGFTDSEKELIVRGRSQKKSNNIQTGDISGALINIEGVQHFDKPVTIIQSGLGWKNSATTQSQSITENPTVTITVPRGTKIDTYKVKSLDVKDVNGPIDLGLDNEDGATVEDAQELTIVGSGDSVCYVFQASGVVKKIHGRSYSRIVVSGAFEDIAIEAMENAVVIISGTCNNLKYEALDSSKIDISHLTVSGTITPYKQGNPTIITA